MKWININDGFPKDKKVLVTYLNPFFGKFIAEVTEINLLVTHWMELPMPSPEFDGLDQSKDFIDTYTNHQYYGSIQKYK